LDDRRWNIISRPNLAGCFLHLLTNLSLLSTSLGVLIVLLGSITGIMDAGFETAREGPVALVGFLEGFIVLFVSVMLILGVFAGIRAAAP